MKNKNIIEILKKNNEDYEFYPTTNEIIDRVKKDIQDINNYDSKQSILDIGAGNGKVLDSLDISRKFAIEKSKTLISEMDKNIVIIGTDFHETTLIDKKADIYFCNPPYSEFKEWTQKIITEGNFKTAYLVIPTRIKDDKEFSTAIKNRNLTHKIIDTFSFEGSEDRMARAKIHLIKIKFEYKSKNSFSAWFDKEFGTLPENDDFNNNWGAKEKRKEEIKNELISKKNLAFELVKLYNKEMLKLNNQFKIITSLDIDVLKTFDITKEKLLEVAEQKISGLKYIYWDILFDNLEIITKRLIFKSRRQTQDKIFDNTSVDFTNNNIEAIILWFLKNSNELLTEQVVDFYEEMLDRANIEAYKSNQKIFKNNNWGESWEEKEKLKTFKVKLTYRIILTYGVNNHSYRDESSITENIKNYLKDLNIIAQELGFSISKDIFTVDYSNGLVLDEYNPDVITNKSYICYFNFEKNDKIETFYEIKFFKNGNAHIKFNKKFIDKLNVIYGKEKGWLTSKEDVAEELDKNCVKYFDFNKYKKIENLQLLGSINITQ